MTNKKIQQQIRKMFVYVCQQHNVTWWKDATWVKREPVQFYFSIFTNFPGNKKILGIFRGLISMNMCTLSTRLCK